MPNEEPPSSRRYELSSPLRLLSPLRRSGSDGDCDRPERIEPSVGELPASSRSDASARLGLPLPAVESRRPSSGGLATRSSKDWTTNRGTNLASEAMAAPSFVGSAASSASTRLETSTTSWKTCSSTATAPAASRPSDWPLRKEASRDCALASVIESRFFTCIDLAVDSFFFLPSRPAPSAEKTVPPSGAVSVIRSIICDADSVRASFDSPCTDAPRSR